MRALKILSSVMLVVLIAHSVSMAQEKPAHDAPGYKTRLADTMVVIQVRHSKLFYAVKAKNWPLANFEYEQLLASLWEAERNYPKTLPPFTHTEEIASSLVDAMKAKDEAKFNKAFDELSAGCNRCHVAEDRAFILIRRPSSSSAYSDQEYTPRRSEGQKQDR
jgi:hypothetical protein